MSQGYIFKFGPMTIGYSANRASSLPAVQARLEPYLSDKGPVNFNFSIDDHIPADFLYDSNELFNAKNWILYSYQGKQLFKKLYHPALKFLLFAHFNSTDSNGSIYYDGANRPSWFFPFEDFILIDLLANKGAGYIHASGVLWNQKVYIFSGFSGVGKSTFASLIMKVNGIELLSDERILLVQESKSIYGYGSPWYSTLDKTSPKGAELAGIFFLRHGKNNQVTPIRPITASSLIYQQFYPAQWDKEKLKSNLALIDSIVSTTPVYHFDFIPNFSAVSFLESFLSGKPG